MNLFPIMQRKSRILIICQFAFVNVNTQIWSGVTELNHKSNVSVDIEDNFTFCKDNLTHYLCVTLSFDLRMKLETIGKGKLTWPVSISLWFGWLFVGASDWVIQWDSNIQVTPWGRDQVNVFRFMCVISLHFTPAHSTFYNTISLCIKQWRWKTHVYVGWRHSTE